jgi:hypothetical protein
MNPFVLVLTAKPKKEKTMNKKKVLSISLITLLLFSGCIVLYGKLIEGKWQVDTYYKNGEEQTEQFFLAFGDYAITFHSDGEFTETYLLLNVVPVTNGGTWELKYNQQKWQLTLVDESQTRIYDIEKLTSKELRLMRDLGEGGNEEFIMERPPEP